MSPKEQAEADQREAKEREFDRKAYRIAVILMTPAILVCIYAMLAAMGFVPAMPWSPLGTP